IGGVFVEDHFTVAGNDAACAGNDQRIDFHERAIELHEHLINALGHGSKRLHLIFAVAQTQEVGQFAHMVGHDARGEADRQIQNLFGGGGGHFFNVRATGATGNKDGRVGRAVDEDAEVDLLFDVDAFFDQQVADGEALDVHAED